MTSACLFVRMAHLGVEPLDLEFRCKSTAKKETAQKMDDFGSVSEVFWKFFGKSRK